MQGIWYWGAGAHASLSKVGGAMYSVEGNHVTGYAVVLHGGVEYDHLESKTEAEEICEALNLGVGPEWDKLQEYFEMRGQR